MTEICEKCEVEYPDKFGNIIHCNTIEPKLSGTYEFEWKDSDTMYSRVEGNTVHLTSKNPTQQHYQAHRIEAAAKAAYCWTHPSSSWDNVKESIKSLYLEESKAALAAADSVQCARSNELNPDMPMQELLLHMGELTAGEIRTARAAIRWANSQCAKGCGDTPILDERLESVIRTLVNGISVQSLEAKHGNLCEALEKLKKYRTQKGD